MKAEPGRLHFVQLVYSLQIEEVTNKRPIGSEAKPDGAAGTLRCWRLNSTGMNEPAEPGWSEHHYQADSDAWQDQIEK
jgi:hypothetical protein